MLRRRGVDNQVGAVERRALIVRGAQRGRERQPGEEASILVRLLNRLRDIRLVRPNHGIVAVRCEDVGERGSPSAGADHGATHQANLAAMRTASTMIRLIANVAAGRLVGTPRLPNRCSSPLRSLTMFARC